MTNAGAGGDGLDHARAVADAVLYEGYLLYPYRHTSAKNRVRWQFGVLVPPDWAREHHLTDRGVAGSAESGWQQTECLVEGGDTLRVRLRFLRLQRRSVEERMPDGAFRPVPRLERGAVSEVSFDEAVPHEFDVAAPIARLLDRPRRFDLELPGGEEVEERVDAHGEPFARLVRRRWPLSAALTVTASAGRAPFPLRRLRIRVENTRLDVPAGAPREEALRHCLLATHTMLAVDSGRFISLLDPPEWAAAEARQCHNVHTFPVLAGPAGTAGTMLSTPIILYDHPRIAPESPGDLHDATEVDEILTLRTLTLADTERLEARATDPRAAAIVDRVETMPPEIFERLHGAIRELRPAREPDGAGPPQTAAEQSAPAVDVDGVSLAPGSRVRLKPRRRGTDAHDMFLAGRTARVQQVLEDVDGTAFLAVTVDDDPGAELHQWYGRLRYFRRDEVQPLPGEGMAE